jgi:hypothetical protein
MKVNEQWKVCLFSLFRGAATPFHLTLFSQKKCEEGASKIQAEFEKKAARYESYIDRLERRAGSVLPGHIKGTVVHPF